MSKSFSLLLIAPFLLSAAYAEEIAMPVFAPRSPVAMGQGGSISSVASGYEALFTNPAGFAAPQREWTISPAAFWVNGDALSFLVSSGLISAPDGYGGPTTTFAGASGYADYLERTAEDGAGYGGSWGVGFVGKGLGLGIVGNFDLFLSGDPFPSDVGGYFVSDVALIGGYTFVPIRGDVFRWEVGADIRPSIRLYAPLTADDFLTFIAAGRDDSLSDAAYTAMMNGVDLYQGAAVALDAGTRLSYGDVTFSLSVRDILDTRYSMRRYGLGDWFDELEDDRKIPDSGKDTGDQYIVPMSSVVGLAYHPDLDSFSRYVDPLVHAEIDDPVDLFRRDVRFIDAFHIGMEIELLRVLKLRAGYDRGRYTGGAGLRLWFTYLDIAGFSDAWGEPSRAVPRSGASVQLSFRF